jgi:hypothetical protein
MRLSHLFFLKASYSWPWKPWSSLVIICNYFCLPS